MTGSPLEPIWDSLIRTIAAMVTLAPEYVVVQVHGDDGPDGGPYVQTLREDDGYLTLEAASNEFLDVPLSVEASSVLVEMGWNSPEPDEGAPNYFYVIGPESTPGEIADFLVRTLRDVYKVSTSAAFEMAPLELFIEVVDGEFGEPSGLTFVRGESDPRKVGY
jgi:hypothetical protein